MQVKVTVHETKIDQVQLGMRANIRVLDRQLRGHVIAIANQAEQTSFFAADVKEYATTVKVDGEPDALKPGMTAEVEILIGNLTDVVSLPVVAVLEHGGKFYSWVKAQTVPPNAAN